MIKKILFFALSIILAVVIYICAYYTVTYNYLFGLIDDSIAEENYTNVTKVFTPFFNDKQVIKVSGEKYKAFVYEGTMGYTKTDEEGKNSTSYFENCYTFFMYGISELELNDIKENDKETKNDTAIILSNNTGQSYTYKFKDTEASRDLITSAGSYGVIQFDFNETILKEKLSGLIQNVKFVDSAGKTIFEETCDLDFESEFYTVTDELITNYNKYTEEKDSDGFNTFYEKWESDYSYTKGFTTKELKPASNTWKIMGIMAIFLVVDGGIGYLVFRKKRK